MLISNHEFNYFGSIRKIRCVDDASSAFAVRKEDSGQTSTPNKDSLYLANRRAFSSSLPQEGQKARSETQEIALHCSCITPIITCTEVLYG